MCGFVFLLDTQIKEDQFLKVIKRIEHRGPDSLNLRKVNNAYLGFVRLAIMDLSQAGDQPFEVDKTHMMCNGEIYNHLSLRQEYEFDYKSRSDCEVILPIFHEGGIIEGSQLKINLKKLGYDVTVFLGVHLKSSKLMPEVISKLNQFPEVVEAHYTTGQYGLLLKIHTQSISDFHDFLAHKLQSLDAVQSTESFISLNQPIDKNIDFH